MTHATIELALCIGALALASAALAWLLRAARFPGGALGAAALAGAIAGVCAGPAGLGRMNAELGERVLGGGAERAALVEARARHAGEVASLERTGVTMDAITELRAEHAREEQALAGALDAARAARRSELARAAGLALALVALFLRLGFRRVEDEESASQEEGEGPGATALAALLGPLVAGGCAAALAARAFGMGWRSALAAGCVAGIATPLFAYGVGGAGAAVSRTVAGAAGFFLPLGAAALATGQAEGATLAFGVAALGALPARRSAGGRAWRRAALALAAPAAMAFAFATVDPGGAVTTRGGLIALGLALVLAFDGRWLGAWAAYRVAGSARERAGAWTRAADHLGPGCGLAQGVAAILLAPALVEGLLAPALVSAVVVEVSSGLRARMGAALDGGAG